MKRHKIAHWIGLSVFAYLTIQKLLEAFNSRIDAGSLQPAVVIGQWGGFLLMVFLSVMLFLRPRSWGLGLGIFLVVVIAAQTGLWLLGVAHIQKQNPGYDGNPGRFVATEILIFAGAVACIALRWIFPNEKPATQGTEIPSSSSPM